VNVSKPKSRKPLFSKVNRAACAALVLLGTVLLSACSSDVKDPTVDGGSSSSGNTDGGQNPGASNGLFSFSVSNGLVTLVEGSNISVQVQVSRTNGHNLPINLAASGQTQSDTEDLYWNFSDTQITGSESSTSLTVGMNIGVRPIQRQTRSLRLIGTDGSSRSIVTVLTLEIEPTSKPDVYLLIGQSNMVGFSEDNAKQANPGGADAPNNRIRQLNVTGNDPENFDSISAFTDENKIAVNSPMFTEAVDPLHDGFDSRIDGKEGKRVGLGLSFAKRAINDTTADIYLVPAAWSNTGFCRRVRPDYEGLLGWNAQAVNNDNISGTLLHDRAIARANLALRESRGILRGILWHQGEADSDNNVCANMYEENIRKLVASLRTNIIQDARGAGARGDRANVPFVLGTMSKGENYIFQPDPKIVVDSVHRNISNIVPFSAFASADDLVPPAFPCGEGDCIHFGAASYREMGSRYYDFLLQAVNQ